MTISIQSKKIIIGKVIYKEFGSDFHYFFDANAEKSSLLTEDKFSFNKIASAPNQFLEFLISILSITF